MQRTPRPCGCTAGGRARHVRFAARTEGLRGACVWRSSHNQKGNHLSVPNLVDFLRRQAELGELGLEHKFKHIIGVEQLQG